MGMYDEVWAPCPKCGEPFVWQSKGGKCNLTSYEIDMAPPEVLADARYGRCENGCDVEGEFVFKVAVVWKFK